MQRRYKVPLILFGLSVIVFGSFWAGTRLGQPRQVNANPRGSMVQNADLFELKGIFESCRSALRPSREPQSGALAALELSCVSYVSGVAHGLVLAEQICPPPGKNHLFVKALLDWIDRQTNDEWRELGSVVLTGVALIETFPCEDRT